MHDSIVKMKDGREFCSYIWESNPLGGYITMPAVSDEKLFFKDMVSAITLGERVDVNTVGDHDVIEASRQRCRQQGKEPDF